MANRDYIVLGQVDHQDLKLGEVRSVMKTPELEEVTVKSKEIVQEILPTEGKYIKKVIVDSVAIDKPDQSKTLYPSTIRQTVVADAGYDLYSVTLEPVTSNIDSNIKARNIKRGVTILGIPGEFDGGELQSKTVTPTKSQQTVEADSKYYGLSSVNINPIPSKYIVPTGTKTITSSGTYDVTNYASANVNVQSKEPTLITKEITASGTYNASDDNADGYSTVVVNIEESGGSEDLSLELNEQITAIDALQEAVDKLPEQDNPSTSTFDRLQWKCDNMKSLQYEFMNYKGEDLDVVLNGLDTSKVETMSYMFQMASNLKRISYLNMESATSASNIANKAYALQDVNFKNIRVNGTFSLSTHSNLTVESLVNIIKELWKLDGDGNTHKLTLGSTNTAKLANVRVTLLGVTGEMMDADPHADKKEPCEVFLDGSGGNITIMEYATFKGWTVT